MVPFLYLTLVCFTQADDKTGSSGMSPVGETSAVFSAANTQMNASDTHTGVIDTHRSTGITPTKSQIGAMSNDTDRSTGITATKSENGKKHTLTGTTATKSQSGEDSLSQSASDNVQLYSVSAFEKMFRLCLNSSHCHDDDECELVKKCCPKWDSNTSNSISQFSFPKITHVTCEKLSPQQNVMMISKCPESGVDSDLKRFCQHGLTLPENTPVRSTCTGLDYRNKFCALCHGEVPSCLIMWKLYLSCNRITTDTNQEMPFTHRLRHTLYHGDCEYVFSAENSANNVCFRDIPGYIRECPNELVIDFVCKLGKNIITITDGNITYGISNVACLDCFDNINVPNSLRQCVADSSEPAGRFSMAMSFSNFSRSVREIVNQPCGEGDIFLNSKIGCVRLHCHAGHIPYYGRCLDQRSNIEVAGGQINLVIIFDSGFNESYIHHKVLSYIFDIKKLAPALRFQGIYDITTEHNIKTDESCILVHEQTTLKYATTTLEKLWKYYNSITSYMKDVQKQEPGVMFLYDVDSKKPPCMEDVFVECELINQMHRVFALEHQNLACPSVELVSGISNNGINIPKTSMDKKDINDIDDRSFICVETFLTNYDNLTYLYNHGNKVPLNYFFVIVVSVLMYVFL